MDTNETQTIMVRLEEQQKKIDQIFTSVERTRKYFKWTLIISVLVIVLPLLGLMVAIPAFLKTLQLPAGL